MVGFSGWGAPLPPLLARGPYSEAGGPHAPLCPCLMAALSVPRPPPLLPPLRHAHPIAAAPPPPPCTYPRRYFGVPAPPPPAPADPFADPTPPGHTSLPLSVFLGVTVESATSAAPGGGGVNVPTAPPVGSPYPHPDSDSGDVFGLLGARDPSPGRAGGDREGSDEEYGEDEFEEAEGAAGDAARDAARAEGRQHEEEVEEEGAGGYGAPWFGGPAGSQGVDLFFYDGSGSGSFVAAGSMSGSVGEVGNGGGGGGGGGAGGGTTVAAGTPGRPVGSSAPPAPFALSAASPLHASGGAGSSPAPARSPDGWNDALLFGGEQEADWHTGEGSGDGGVGLGGLTSLASLSPLGRRLFLGEGAVEAVSGSGARPVAAPATGAVEGEVEEEGQEDGVEEEEEEEEEGDSDQEEEEEEEDGLSDWVDGGRGNRGPGRW